MPAAVAIPLITAAAAAGTTVVGSKMASNSAKRASAVTDRSNTAVMDEDRRRDDEAKRQWDADQAQRAKEFAAAEDDRAYRRQQDEYQQQLLRDREARLAPYRQASAAALGNLGQLLGINLGGSPLAQNLAAPRSTGPASSAPMPPPTAPPGAPPAQGGRVVIGMGMDGRTPMYGTPDEVGRYQTLGHMTGLQPMRRLA